MLIALCVSLPSNCQHNFNKKIKIIKSIITHLQVLHETLDKYEPTEIFLSFNGGKDCTVLLDIFARLFSERYPDVKLYCLYIQPNNPFDEIEEFIRDCQNRYNIEVETIRGSVKGALFEMCEQHPQLKTCVMGCRRTDPYCNNLDTFQATDQGWPSLMRVNPLLDWTCKNIWDYLHEAQVPYCNLYANG